MGYNISALEGQNGGRDWPLIVTAVKCKTCGAEPGEMCLVSGSVGINKLLKGGQERIDWHADRKQDAAHAWYTRHETAQQPTEEAAKGDERESIPSVEEERAGETEASHADGPAGEGSAAVANLGAAGEERKEEVVKPPKKRRKKAS